MLFQEGYLSGTALCNLFIKFLGELQNLTVGKVK